ncbi:uncharacterized protein LOC118484723 [Helianthus annuus]|uniref:uncharacterized protein LOC118484723 n=1 Tax=Helianthus annuus TaxID=4232 RepID=UPI001653033D|nr:uncharacterized protein LOC118484723 [Helianthus annuus]
MCIGKKVDLRIREEGRSLEEGISRDKGKAEVVCYKCKQRGHYASECKTKKLKDVAYYQKKLEEAKKQEQVSLIVGKDTWQSEDSSDEEEEEEEEMANFCIMALSDELPETSGQKKSDSKKSDDLQRTMNKIILENQLLIEESLDHRAKIEFHENERKDLYMKINDKEINVREENVVATGGDQTTDKGNLVEKIKSFSTTHGEPEKVQGYEENQNLNEFQFSGKGIENMDYFNPLNLRTAENVFSAGVKGRTSVVPPITQEHQSLSTEQLHKKLEDITAVCTRKTAIEGKLDLILEEIRNQKSNIKVLSETIKDVQKQTEDNTAAHNKLHESSENREGSSEFKNALKELQEIKKQMTEVASAGECSNSGRILEEIQFLRANNSSMAEFFEKLMVELSAQKDQNKLEFHRMKKQDESNAQTLANIHLVVKRLQ